MGRKKFDSDTFRLTDEQATTLAKEGAAPGLTKGQARFNALMGRCVGRRHGPTPNENAKQFMVNFDRHMLELAKKSGLELRDDGEEPSIDGD